MKKILFSAYSLDVGGIETALITLLKNIKNDYEITLCLEKKEGIFLNELPKNVKIITYKPSNLKMMPIRKILNFIKQQIFKIKYKHAIFAVLIVALPISLIGFSNLISTLYPMFGVLSLVFIAQCIYFYFFKLKK